MELQVVNQEEQGLNTLWTPWIDGNGDYNEFYTYLEYDGAHYQFILSDANYTLIENKFKNTENIEFRDDSIYLNALVPHSVFESILQILMIKL